MLPNQLLVEETDQPFFADRLFANRFINLVSSFRHGMQQNRIYLIEGPHGSGKSTFLNNLLQKFEQYTKTDKGATYETVWRLDKEALGAVSEETRPSVGSLCCSLSSANPCLIL